MWNSLTRTQAIGIWTAFVTATLGVLVTMQLLPLSFTGALLLGLLCVVPPSVMLMVWRGAPPPTVAETLESVDRRR